MTFLEHFNSLRKHIWFSIILCLLGTVLSLYFYDHIVTILSAPIISIIDSSQNELYMTTIYEGLFAKLKISLISGIIITLPVHTINIIVFVFPALSIKEKKIASGVIISGFILCIGGLLYGYNYVVPISISFLTGKNIIVENSSFLLGFTKNIFYILQFIGALMVIFQVPLLLILLISLRVISIESAIKYGKHVVVLSFILSAVITPPDFISQLMTALPLVILYYLALFIAWIFKLGG